MTTKEEKHIFESDTDLVTLFIFILSLCGVSLSGLLIFWSINRYSHIYTKKHLRLCWGCLKWRKKSTSQQFSGCEVKKKLQLLKKTRGGGEGCCAHLQVIEAEWREWGCKYIWSLVDREKVNLWNEEPKWWPPDWLALILSRFGCYPMRLESWLNFFWKHPWEFSRKV